MSTSISSMFQLFGVYVYIYVYIYIIHVPTFWSLCLYLCLHLCHPCSNFLESMSISMSTSTSSMFQLFGVYVYIYAYIYIIHVPTFWSLCLYLCLHLYHPCSNFLESMSISMSTSIPSMFQLCGVYCTFGQGAVMSTSSPGPRFPLPQLSATRLMASVAPLVKTILKDTHSLTLSLSFSLSLKHMYICIQT